MNQQLLVVGVDPGTTLAYAILDINGELVSVRSSKSFDLRELVKETTGEGVVLVLGTDKKKCPSMIQKLAAKTGARIISPRSDLLTKEKGELTKDFEVANEHEADALASAMFAYKRIQPLLKRIDAVLKEKGKEGLADEVKRTVVTREISIVSALRLLEPENMEAEERLEAEPEAEERIFSCDEYFLLRKRYKQSLKDNKLLRMQNSKLARLLSKLRNEQAVLDKKISRRISEEKAREISDFKERRIKALQSEAEKKRMENAELEEEIKKLNLLVNELKTGVLLKKLNNLGWEEFVAKNRILNIQEGDFLLVEEPNVYSQKTVEQLKNRVSIILTKNRANKKTKEDTGMVFIDANSLSVKENKYFAVADKGQLEKEKNKTNILTKIVEDYKEERKR